MKPRAFLPLALSLLVLSDVSAADSALVTVGPGKLRSMEAGADTILIDNYSNTYYLMVEPKIGVFTGLTYKFGIKFTRADYDAVMALEAGKKTKIKIQPISDNNIGKSFVDCSFTTTKPSGRSFRVEIDPAASGQKTYGTIDVRRLGCSDDETLKFDFNLKVKGLRLEELSPTGSVEQSKVLKNTSHVGGMVRVTR